MGPQSSQLAHRVTGTSRSIRVLIDGRKIGHGGIGVYIENLIQGLLTNDEAEITVIASHEQAAAVPFVSDVAWIYDAARPYSLDELFLLPRRINFSSFDIFHTPHYMLPFGIPIPTVVTVHDVIHISHPEKFYYPVVARTLIRSAVKRADAVVAVSQDTRRSLVELTGAASEKVYHVPNAVADFLGSNDAASEVPEEVDRERGFFLSVLSNNKPHKRVHDLVSAYRNFRRRYRTQQSTGMCPELLLVGAGAEDARRDPSVREVVAATDGVRFVGRVTRSHLKQLYTHARAVVVPSLAEGFCLPALEAQACGTPVICRPVAAVEELVTERDIVAEDDSVAALERALRRGLDLSVDDKQVIGSHLKRFSLPVVAEALRGVYFDVLHGRGR